MATISNSSIYLNAYNGGWRADYFKTSEITTSSVNIKKTGGYAASKSYVTVLRFKTTVSDASNIEGTQLVFTVPYVRSSSTATSGTFYAKLTTTDPASGSGIGTIPSSSNYDATCDWNTSSQSVKTATFTINKYIAANTTYYLIIGTNKTNAIQIGESSDAGRAFSINFTYTVYGTYKVTVAVKDTGNSYTISGQVTVGTGYTFDGATLYWTDDGTYPHETNYDNTHQYTHSITSTGSYSISRTISSSKYIRAVVCYSFKKANGEYICEYTDYTESIYIEYVNRALGSGGSISIVDNTDNTFSFKVTTPSSGTNNEIESTTIWYWLDDNDADLKTTSATTSPNTTSTVKSSSTITKNTKVTARLIVNFKYAVNGNSGIILPSTSPYTVSSTITYRGPIGTPTVSASDNGNNTFTITGTAASKGAGSNTATTKWYYSYSSTGADAAESAKDTEITPDFGGDSVASKNVYVQAKATAKYLNSKYAKQTNWVGPVTVKHYVAPSKPGVPTLTYTGNRLTNKVPWTFKWSAATATNSSSPIKGYTIKVNRKSKDTDKTTTEINTTTTSTSYEVSDPTAYNFVAGDTLTFTVSAFTRDKDGTGTKISSGTTSVTGTVANAGVVRINTSSGWKEGQVYVKVSSGWVEAESVNVKTADGWKEAQ